VVAFPAAALSIVVLKLEPRFAALAAAMAVAAGLPTLPPIARRLARIGVARLKEQEELPLPPAIPADIGASLHGINVRLLASGWLAAAVCWLFLGLSLWATLRAIGVEQIHPLYDLPRLVAAVAFAVVAGFLSMLPGGLVVRDALLMQLLAPVCGEANALVASLLLRLVWLLTEVVVCGILYIGARSKQHGAEIPER
jgi:glycosyltransferase 2 family protein